MPYYNNFSQYYPQTQNQFTTPQVQNVAQQNNSGITWVQGENSAKSYPVLAGQSILLMDSENSVFYIKSTDQSGMPLPLRVFDYQERVQARSEHPQAVIESKGDYISRDEFDTFKDEIRAEIRQVNKPISTASKTTAKEK